MNSSNVAYRPFNQGPIEKKYPDAEINNKSKSLAYYTAGAKLLTAAGAVASSIHIHQNEDNTVSSVTGHLNNATTVCDCLFASYDALLAYKGKPQLEIGSDSVANVINSTLKCFDCCKGDEKIMAKNGSKILSFGLTTTAINFTEPDKTPNVSSKNINRVFGAASKLVNMIVDCVNDRQNSVIDKMKKENTENIHQQYQGRLDFIDSNDMNAHRTNRNYTSPSNISYSLRDVDAESLRVSHRSPPNNLKRD